jgi:hypothetical protein
LFASGEQECGGNKAALAALCPSRHILFATLRQNAEGGFAEEANKNSPRSKT